MITDRNNCREVTLGNGTVFLETDTTGKTLIIGEKPKTLVGTPYTEGSGDDCTKVDYKTVCLRFDGKNAAESVKMLDEYLEKIKTNLKIEKISSALERCIVTLNRRKALKEEKEG